MIATAGHVDHGKSALVRSLTGIEPDRWAEERRRGLTIDLGFTWTRLDDQAVAFVDVPGHQRFIGNMLAGIGPVPLVLLVVAADEGWRAQTQEHLEALEALGVRHGVVAVTRADLADPSAAMAQVEDRLRGTGLDGAPVVAVSARTGAGLGVLRDALSALVAGAPPPDPEDRLRLWVDRAFTVGGAGTVVTGTLASGWIRLGDTLDAGGCRAVVRGLQSHERGIDEAMPVSRVAVNLRGVPVSAVGRGTALLAPGRWPAVGLLDVRRSSGLPWTAAGAVLTLHVGTAAVPCRIRPFDDDHARLRPAHPLPLQPGDRLILRDPGAQRIHAGAVVLDVDPPALSRRGAAAAHLRRLGARPLQPDAAAEVSRRGAARLDELRRLGVPTTALPPGVHQLGDWWIAESALAAWSADLRDRIERLRREDPVSPGLSEAAAVRALRLPDPALLEPVVERAGLGRRGGFVHDPGWTGLGAADRGLEELVRRLEDAPFGAPESGDLDRLGLDRRALAAAERTGVLLRLPAEPIDIVLLPRSPALAMRVLAELPQPFTLSEARVALGTTRRVAVPLLEHLDALGWTRRVDGQRREVVSGFSA